MGLDESVDGVEYERIKNQDAIDLEDYQRYG